MMVFRIWRVAVVLAGEKSTAVVGAWRIVQFVIVNEPTRLMIGLNVSRNSELVRRTVLPWSFQMPWFRLTAVIASMVTSPPSMMTAYESYSKRVRLIVDDGGGVTAALKRIPSDALRTIAPVTDAEPATHRPR